MVYFDGKIQTSLQCWVCDTNKWRPTKDTSKYHCGFYRYQTENAISAAIPGRGLIFSKNHPILKKTIDLICTNIKNNSYPNDIHKTTGPSVYSKAINEIHIELFNNTINHKDIKKETDITYKSNNTSYHLYGLDYNSYLRQEQREKPLII